jgi:hypothetical protein
MAIVIAPGQSVSQPDWDALAHQHGESKGEPTRVGRTEEQIKAAALAGDPDPGAQQRPIYRYYFTDGTYVDARTSVNGADYEIVDYKPSSQYKPAEASTPASKRTAREEAEIAANAGLPPDQDPRAETNAERAARADATRKQQDTTVASESFTGTGKNRKKVTTYQSGRSVTVDAPEAEEKPGAPTLKPDGRGGTIAVQAMPDGSIKTTPLPGVPSDKPAPERVPVNGVVYERQPDGTYAPAKGLPTESKPGSVVTIEGETYWATPNADPGQPPQLTHLNPGGALPKDDGPQFTPGMSPSDYLQQRRQWLLAQRRAGVSQKEVDTIWDRDVQTATARQNEANTQATQQNQRLSTSMTGFGQALTAVQDINKYLPQGSDLGGQALDAFLTLQRGQAQRSGGYGPTGPLAVPAAPTVADPSSQVAAIPQPPATYATAGPPPPPARALPAPLLPPRPPVTLPNAGAGPGEPPARSAIPSAQRPPAAARQAPARVYPRVYPPGRGKTTWPPTTCGG